MPNRTNPATITAGNLLDTAGGDGMSLREGIRSLNQAMPANVGDVTEEEGYGFSDTIIIGRHLVEKAFTVKFQVTLSKFGS